MANRVLALVEILAPRHAPGSRAPTSSAPGLTLRLPGRRHPASEVDGEGAVVGQRQPV